MTVHGGLKIHGRSDAVLNPGGVRIGTAEVCAPAMMLDDVLDTIAVGHRQAADERIVLFVVLRDGVILDNDLTQAIKGRIRDYSSPRHVPAEIIQVPDIPRTMSGKPVELAVRAVIHNEPVPNRNVLANPESLEYFRDRL